MNSTRGSPAQRGQAPVVYSSQQPEYLAWIARPAGEMCMGLAEWLKYKREHGNGLQRVAQNLASCVQFTAEPSGRVRHAAGEMNGLEKRYAGHLEERKAVGEILTYQFEPKKFVLAPKTTFTVDFLVLVADWSLEAHEVKGHWEDDARVKIKVAATMFSSWRFVGVTWNKPAKSWEFEVFPS